jgi:hypothetical protein
MGAASLDESPCKKAVLLSWLRAFPLRDTHHICILASPHTLCKSIDLAPQKTWTSGL